MKKMLTLLTVALAMLFSAQAAIGDAVSISNIGAGGYGASTFSAANETYSLTIPTSEKLTADDWVCVNAIALGMNSSSDAAKTPKYLKVNGVLSQIVNGTGNQVTNVKFSNNSLKQTYTFARLLVHPGTAYTVEFCSDAAGTKMGEMRWYMVNSEASAPLAQSTTSPGWRITQEVTGKVVDAGTIECDNRLPTTEEISRVSSENWVGTLWIKNYRPTAYWAIPFNYGTVNSVVRFSNSIGYFANGTYPYVVDLVDEGEDIALTVNAGGASSTTRLKLSGSGTLKNTYAHTHLFQIDAATYGFTGSLDVGGKRFQIGTGTSANQNQIVVDEGQTATISAGSSWTATAGVIVNGRVNVEGGAINNTITGTGTVAYPTLAAADANKTSFQASAWHGKVEIAPIVTTGSTAVQFNLHEYGNENSTLVLKGLSGTAGRYLPAGTHIKPTVEIVGTVEFNNGGWTANYYFDGGVTGSGDLKLLNWRENDGFGKGYHIAKLFNYTGTLKATRATTIDELALTSEPETDSRLIKLESGSTETLKVTKVTVNGEPLSASKRIEVRADGVYCVAGEITTEETTEVFGLKTISAICIGNGGVQKFAGTGGVRVEELTIKNGGKLVTDPIKAPIHLIGGAMPTLNDGAKIALESKYADYKKGVFTLMTWEGDTAATTVIPEGLFEATTAQLTNGPKLTLETYTTHVDNSNGAAKTYTALKLDLDPNGVKPKLTIMPLGDSITEGSNPDGLANPNYRVILMAKMASLGYDVKSTGMRMIKNWNAAGVYQPMEWSWHSGVSGQTLVSTGARAGWRDSLEAMLDASEIPDIITFKIGTNDSLAGRNVDQSVAEWVEVMRRIITARPSTKIIVGSIMPFSNGGTWGDWNAKLKAAIENNTYDFPEGQVFYAPLAENCLREMDGKSNFVDSLHPNWTGHERNAETWAKTITSVLAEYPAAPGTYVPNEKTGAAANVGAEYIKGFTKLATFTPDGTVIAKDAEPNYSFKAEGLADKKILKVGYYMELRNTRSGNVRWVWADMDNWNEDKSFAKIGIPTAYTYCGAAQNLHVDSNDAGIEKILPTVSGKTAWLQFTRGDLLKDVAAEGAPAAYSPRDWNDACDDNGNYGVMNLYRVAPTAVSGGVNALPAQVLMAYSRWTQNKQQIGIGNFMVHGQPLVYGNISDMPVNYYGTQDFERLNLASYELASIEIWGVPETTVPTTIEAVTAENVMTVAPQSVQSADAGKLASWIKETSGITTIAGLSSINANCFLLGVANQAADPEFLIEADDLSAVLTGELAAIEAKYPNATVSREDVTEKICGAGAANTRLYRLKLQFR